MKFDDLFKKLMTENEQSEYKPIQELNTIEEIQARINEIEQEMEEGEDVITPGSYSYDVLNGDLQYLYNKLSDLKAQQEQEHNEYEHKGWPGDGSGEDDFADYNQMEGNDY